MSEPMYKTPEDVPYIDDSVSIAVMEHATQLLSNFPVLAHDLNMVGMAMRLHADELTQQYPETIPDEVVLDVERQLYTHYIAALVSACNALVQAARKERESQLNKQILDANGEPLDLFKR